METFLFYVFGCFAVISALMVITRRNPINSAVWLLATFATVAALFILMNAPFIAMVQITVYAGAILVLILFVIMLLNLREPGKGFFNITSSGQRVAALLVGAVLLGEFFWVLVSGNARIAGPKGEYTAFVAERVGNTQALGNVLFSKYVWPFEVVSILLIVAIVGSVILTRRSEGGSVETPEGEGE